MKQSLLRFIHEHIGDVVLLLICAAIVATVQRLGGVPFDGQPVTLSLPETVDVGSKLIETALAVVGAIIAYRKFFKGRTLATRVRLGITSKPVRWLSSGAGEPRTLLHSIDVDVENIGTVTLWEPDLRVRLRRVGEDEDLDVPVLTEGIDVKLAPGGISGIDPGEISTHHYRVEIPESLRVFRVCVDLVAGKRDAWHRAATLANTFKPEDE